MKRAVLLALSLTLVAGCRLTPNEPFDEADAPPAPDYADDSSWAALPDRDSGEGR